MLRTAPLLLLSLLGAAVAALEDEPDAFLHRLLAEDMEQRQELLRQHLAPATVSLPAGQRSLADAIDALRRADAGDILLQLGTGDQTTQDVPAIDSTWWSALLNICRQFRVEPVPSPTLPAQREQHIRQFARFGSNRVDTGQHIFGGPVQLRPATRQGPGSLLAQLHPCGPLLVETFDIAVTDIRHLKGESHSAELRFRLRLQPGLRDDLIRHATVSWEAATDEDGTALTIEEQADQNPILRVIGDLPTAARRDNVRHQRWSSTGSSQLRLGQLPGTCRQAQLRGAVELACGAPLHLQVALTAGDEGQAADSPVPIRCTFIEPAADDLQQRHRLSVRYRAQDFVVHPQITISDPNGNPVRHYNRNTVPSEDEFRTDVYSLAAPLPGEYQIRLDGTIDLGTVILPLLLQVPLP